jgi:uncharacterized protein (UPF0216 family)
MVLESESAMERWLKFEFHNLNKNIVKNQVRLSDLIKMEKPKTETRDGNEYLFDNLALKKFSEDIPLIYHNQLRLPIFFYKDLRVKDSCFLIDEIAVSVLKHTNDLEFCYKFTDGKLWLSRPIAFDITRKYPTLFQFVIY